MLDVLLFVVCVSCFVGLSSGWGLVGVKEFLSQGALNITATVVFFVFGTTHRCRAGQGTLQAQQQAAADPGAGRKAPAPDALHEPASERSSPGTEMVQSCHPLCGKPACLDTPTVGA